MIIFTSCLHTLTAVIHLQTCKINTKKQNASFTKLQWLTDYKI